MKFQERIKKHLSDYKLNSLGISEPGVWKTNGKCYAHILPIPKYELNFLEIYRTDLSAYIQDQNIKLHRDFHHLNSSQVLCLNFFYPLIAEKQEHLLLQALKLHDETIESCTFEKIFPQAEGTNFDFYVQLQSGRQLFFEIKYTEEAFGKVAPSNWDTEKYRKKYQNIYKHTLTGKIRKNVNEYEELMKNYQLLRNISYIDMNTDDLFIILCPRNHTKLHKEYAYVINNVVNPALHKNIRLITWEDMLDELHKIIHFSPNSPTSLLSHYSMFKDKYLNDGG